MDIPAYRASLTEVHGECGPVRLKEIYDANIAAFNGLAKKFYINSN